ncbi:hypothetical protein SAMN04488168_11371 [Bacillus sp. 491mf]|nr:hypothetical protein SAMN04488168_11371 [Bacillus sp. 491mf]
MCYIFVKKLKLYKKGKRVIVLFPYFFTRKYNIRMEVSKNYKHNITFLLQKRNIIKKHW